MVLKNKLLIICLLIVTTLLISGCVDQVVKLDPPTTIIYNINGFNGDLNCSGGSCYIMNVTGVTQNITIGNCSMNYINGILIYTNC